MSANINKYCIVNNLDDLKVILVPEEKTKQEALQDDDYDNRWNWDTSELVYDAEEDPRTKNLWLTECKLALSPLSDMLVIGRNKVLTIFNLKRSINVEDNVHEFNMVYNTSLPGLGPEESLTSILLVPFVAQQKTLVNFRDWTAILVGFSSGYFRIFAENGKVLLSYFFHDEPIVDIKCRTHSANSLLAEQVDEILIVYPSAVIQVDGFTLYQTLRMYRNNLAKSQHVDSTGQGYFSSMSNVSSDDQMPFTFKKWSFNSSSDTQINDCVNVCSNLKNDFDALVSHTITGSPLNNDTANLFFTTGIHPFVGFYRAQEGITHTIFNELSQALLNKVKTVFSFFGQSKSKEPDSRENIKPAANVECNLGLYDERLGLKICISPNRRLAAVVDDFGRVLLFDIANSIAVRIWKGYRKAEVAWIVVDEDSTQEYTKQALFLAIYAPKRGILEIWCTQNGPRVTAFKVGKNCKLIYHDYTMFGLNHIILQNIKNSMPQADFMQTFSHSKCFLFNHETGEFFSVNVPFLCALTDRNSKKTRDIHILKDLKLLLKKQENNLYGDKLEKSHQQVVSLILMLKTAEIRRECLEELIRLSNDALLIYLCAQKVHSTLFKYIEKDELDFENKLVVQMCARIMQICKAYIKIKEKLPRLVERIAKLKEESLEHPDIQQLIERLGGWSGQDVARLFSFLAFQQAVLKSPIHPLDKELNVEFAISDMLTHFTLYYTHLVKKNYIEIYENLPIEIILMRNSDEITEKRTQFEQKTNNNYVSLDKLSLFLFNSTFCGDELNLDYLLNEACIYPSNLLLLLFTSWLHSSYSNYWCCWENMSRALFKIVDIMNGMRQNEESEENLLFDSNMDDSLLAPSWNDIIELIYKSTNMTSALTSVNMIKCLINKLKLNAKDISELNLKEKNETAENNEIGDFQTKNDEIQSTHSVVSSDNDWETLHLDKENLSLLTKQLEDLFLLDMLLKSNLCSAESEQQIKLNLGQNTVQKTDSSTSRSNSVSLSFILSSGPGIVSEIVARWAVHHKIAPELLICSPSADASLLDNEDNSVVIADESTQLKRTIESSIPAVSGMSEHSDRMTLMDILDHVRRCFPNCLESDILLINCCWELLLQWHSQPLILSGDLHLTLSYLEKVSSSVLKHNVACMAWRLFFQKRFETLCGLIEKMGKRPKDRICRKELDMDENTLEQFINFCCDLLDFMISTSFSSETEPLPLYTLDEWWCGFNASNQYGSHYIDEALSSKANLPSNIDQQSMLSTQTKQILNEFSASNVPLAVMAIHQKVANVDLLVEYSHLALSVQFAVLFSLKSVRPLSLFPSSVRAYFFKDLYSFLTPNANEQGSIPTDPVLNEGRYKFMYSVITAIVQTLPVYRDESDRLEGQKFYSNANKWFGKVLLLCREWNLNADLVRLQYVHDLFLFGCDPLAEEMMPTVSDVKALGRKLLVIAGMRSMNILNSRFGSLDEISFLPPNVLFWLKSLVTDANCNVDCPLPSTVLLFERISNNLHDDEANGRICNELLAALKKL